MKFLKFIALVFISIGAFSTIDPSLADNKNPEKYKHEIFKIYCFSFYFNRCIFNY